jgi:hypothetical protein
MDISYNHSTIKYCRTGNSLLIRNKTGFYQYYPNNTFIRSGCEMWVEIIDEDNSWLYFRIGITKNKISKQVS